VDIKERKAFYLRARKDPEAEWRKLAERARSHEARELLVRLAEIEREEAKSIVKDSEEIETQSLIALMNDGPSRLEKILWFLDGAYDSLRRAFGRAGVGLLKLIDTFGIVVLILSICFTFMNVFGIGTSALVLVAIVVNAMFFIDIPNHMVTKVGRVSLVIWLSLALFTSSAYTLVSGREWEEVIPGRKYSGYLIKNDQIVRVLTYEESVDEFQWHVIPARHPFQDNFDWLRHDERVVEQTFKLSDANSPLEGTEVRHVYKFTTSYVLEPLSLESPYPAPDGVVVEELAARSQIRNIIQQVAEGYTSEVPTPGDFVREMQRFRHPLFRIEVVNPRIENIHTEILINGEWNIITPSKSK
jgi:hypothetical protein